MRGLLRPVQIPTVFEYRWHVNAGGSTAGPIEAANICCGLARWSGIVWRPGIGVEGEPLIIEESSVVDPELLERLIDMRYRQDGGLVPAAEVVDLLLDIRNEADDFRVASRIDPLLSTLAARRMLSQRDTEWVIDEVLGLCEALDLPALPRRGGTRLAS